MNFSLYDGTYIHNGIEFVVVAAAYDVVVAVLFVLLLLFFLLLLHCFLVFRIEGILSFIQSLQTLLIDVICKENKTRKAVESVKIKNS